MQYFIGSLIVLGGIIWITENIANYFGARIFNYLPKKFGQSIGIPVMITVLVFVFLSLAFLIFGEKGDFKNSFKIITFIVLTISSYFASFSLVSFLERLFFRYFSKQKVGTENSCLGAVASMLLYVFIVFYLAKIIFK